MMSRSVMKKLSLLEHHKALRVVIVMVLVLPFSLLISYWCHSNNSLDLTHFIFLLPLALTAFAYLTFFNVASLAISLLSIWASHQKPSAKYSFGLDRVNVLAVLSITVLLILFGLNLVKHSIERISDPPVVLTDNMFLALVLGVTVHLVVSCGAPNIPLQRASEAARRNWLQRALRDCGYSISAVSPPLGQILRMKLNPIALLVMGGAVSLIMTQVLIDLDELYVADVMGALFISALIFSTMFPLSVCTAKILLQTAPHRILPLLDKTLREASTLDGVLGMKNEHFWTITFGSYAGSLDVRVRRQANEQEVLTQLTSRLASHLNDLTIQVVKEDWSLPTGPSSTSSHVHPLPNPASVGITRYPPEMVDGAYKDSMPSQLGTSSAPQVGHYSFNPALKQELHTSHLT